MEPNALSEYLQTHDIADSAPGTPIRGRTNCTNSSIPPSQSLPSPSKRQLEQDLRTAAEVGQALLATYKTTARENRQLKMQLDEVNQRLEEMTSENLKLLGSNDELLRTQSEINDALMESNCRLDNLQDELSDARFRIVKLNGTKQHQDLLSCQVEHLEQVREQLTTELDLLREDKRQSDMMRYKTQREFDLLQEQYRELELKYYTEAAAPTGPSCPALYSGEEEGEDSDSTLPTSPDISMDSIHIKKRNHRHLHHYYHHQRHSSIATTILSMDGIPSSSPIQSSNTFWPKSRSTSTTLEFKSNDTVATFTSPAAFTDSKSLLQSFISP